MQKLDKGPDEEASSHGDDLPAGSYRIGGVARLSGVPTTTLRVWETRYQAFTPAKSSGRHRLYVESDVIKARLIRQLTGAGHTVSAIARLPVSELQRLLGGTPDAAGPSPAPGRISAIVVGAAMAARIDSPRWRHRELGEAMDVRHVFPNLAAAADAPALPAAERPDLLLVRLNALHVSAHTQLMRAVARTGAGRTIVLYNYGAEPVLDALRAAGMTLRREPVPEADLVQLVRSMKVVDPGRSMSGFASGGAIPPRRFSDEALEQIASAPTSILCECPHHIVELIQQLASFEEYSGECLNDNEEDARVHSYLRSISGSARALFEHALQVVAQHGGVTLPAPAAD